MTPAAERQVSLKAGRRCKARPGLASTCRRAAGARWRASQCGRPSSLLVSRVRCGARMTQPVWPVQCSTSRAASFSGRSGSPALPKIDSTKSRLLTRLPGRRSGSPSSSGPDAGDLGADDRPQEQRDEAPARLGRSAVNGTVSRSAGGDDRGRNSTAEADAGRPSCHRGSAGPPRRCGRCPRGAAVAARVVQHAVPHAVRADIGVPVAVRILRERQLAGDPVPGQDQRLAGQAQRRGRRRSEK